jgi:hypothetical protein
MEYPFLTPQITQFGPFQFTINELPYIHWKENVMVAGLWFGPEKHRMDTFLLIHVAI